MTRFKMNISGEACPYSQLIRILESARVGIGKQAGLTIRDRK